MLGCDRSKSKVTREWIIFSLCLGIGAHVVLGIALHSPELWPLKSLWIYGFFISFSLYVVVQLSRSVWWWVRSISNSNIVNSTDDGC